MPRHRPGARSPSFAGPPLPIGSVKTNLGHMEPASGIPGILKAILVLRHRVIPPSLHGRPPNPSIDFDVLGLAPVHESRSTGGGRGVVGVNSFGFGGANAHAVLAEPPDPRPPQSTNGQSANGWSTNGWSGRGRTAGRRTISCRLLSRAAPARPWAKQPIDLPGSWPSPPRPSSTTSATPRRAAVACTRTEPSCWRPLRRSRRSDWRRWPGESPLTARPAGWRRAAVGWRSSFRGTVRSGRRWVPTCSRPSRSSGRRSSRSIGRCAHCWDGR